MCLEKTLTQQLQATNVLLFYKSNWKILLPMILALKFFYTRNYSLLKPPLRIDEVIRQFNSLKINIEVVNLSAAEIDQILISNKDTK